MVPRTCSLLTFLLIFSVAACSDDDENNNTKADAVASKDKGSPPADKGPNKDTIVQDATISADQGAAAIPKPLSYWSMDKSDITGGKVKDRCAPPARFGWYCTTRS